jgi:hypothetical protein
VRSAQHFFLNLHVTSNFEDEENTVFYVCSAWHEQFDAHGAVVR